MNMHARKEPVYLTPPRDGEAEGGEGANKGAVKNQTAGVAAKCGARLCAPLYPGGAARVRHPSPAPGPRHFKINLPGDDGDVDDGAATAMGTWGLETRRRNFILLLVSR